MDNDDASHVTLTGRWRRDNDPHRSYGRDFLTARKGEGRLVARYMPEIVEAGEYEVYLYFPKPYPGDESGTMAVAWSDGREVWKEMIDKQSVLIEGADAGRMDTPGADAPRCGGGCLRGSVRRGHGRGPHGGRGAVPAGAGRPLTLRAARYVEVT